MKKLKSKKYYLLISFLVLLITLVVYRGIDLLFISKQEEINNTEAYLIPVKEIPVLKSKLDPELLRNLEIATDEAVPTTISDSLLLENLSANAAYVVDVDTGTVLFDRNSERILLPASTTKLMTALVALDVYDLNSVITVPQLPYIVGLKGEFKVDEKITVENLLKAALIESSNDAAYILATASASGYDDFVSQMNKKAKDLSLKSSKYENPAGFDNDIQRSSALDLVILSQELMKDEFLSSVVSTKETVVTDITGEFEHHLFNTHELVGIDPTVVGIKTGTTQGASQVLVTQFNRDGHNIIIVIMGSDDRYLETKELIDWVFDSYVWVKPEEIVSQN